MHYSRVTYLSEQLLSKRIKVGLQKRPIRDLLTCPRTQALAPTRLNAALDAEDSCLARPSAALRAESLVCRCSMSYEPRVPCTTPATHSPEIRQNKMAACTKWMIT
eukprot:1026368-Pelagomonas_calceolata.AAC.4